MCNVFKICNIICPFCGIRVKFILFNHILHGGCICWCRQRMTWVSLLMLKWPGVKCDKEFWYIYVTCLGFIFDLALGKGAFKKFGSYMLIQYPLTLGSGFHVYINLLSQIFLRLMDQILAKWSLIVGCGFHFLICSSKMCNQVGWIRYWSSVPYTLTKHFISIPESNWKLEPWVIWWLPSLILNIRVF